MTAIVSPSSGDPATAAWAQTVAAALNAYGCVLLRTADQTLTTSTDTAITFPTGSMTEQLDSHGFHSGSTNTPRITVPTGGDGWYEIGATVGFDSDSTGNRAVWIELNGKEGTGSVIAEDRRNTTTGAACRFGVSTQYLLAAADYVTLNVRQASGGDLNTETSTYAVRFWAVRRYPTG